MLKFLERWKYKLPKKINKVWYNRSVHISNMKYPIIFNENKRYINCEIGLKVVMNEFENGKKAFYKVSKIRNLRGGDWLYDSDNIECDLEFSHIE